MCSVCVICILRLEICTHSKLFSTTIRNEEEHTWRTKVAQRHFESMQFNCTVYYNVNKRGGKKHRRILENTTPTKFLVAIEAKKLIQMWHVKCFVPFSWLTPLNNEIPLTLWEHSALWLVLQDVTTKLTGKANWNTKTLFGANQRHFKQWQLGAYSYLTSDGFWLVNSEHRHVPQLSGCAQLGNHINSLVNLCFCLKQFTFFN